MRVNMDESIANDPRFKKLGIVLGIDWKEAVGSCFLVWLVAYNNRKATLSIEDVDIAAQREGFAEGLIESKLATRSARGKLLLHGLSDRIKFLKKQAEKGAKGGKESGKSRRQKAEAKGSPPPEAEPEAYTHAPDLTLTHAPDLSLKTTHVSRSSSSTDPHPLAGDDPTPRELKNFAKLTKAHKAIAPMALRIIRYLNSESGTVFQLVGGHLKFISARLDESDAEERDFKLVIWDRSHAWRDWDKRDEMLRPKTLFNSVNFDSYLSAARRSAHVEKPEEAQGSMFDNLRTSNE